MIRLLLMICAGLLAMPATAQQRPLEVEVLRASAGSLHANIALIKGEKKAVLVDVPFTMADAHRVVAMVLDSGKELETIFITHDHPDHFFAMEVLTQAFPDARIVAHPDVVADIWRSLPFKVKRWKPVLGANGPRMPTAPSPLDGDTILLEGQALKVLGPMAGDHHHATALWAPSIKALFPSDIVFNEVHLWLGEHDPAAVVAWSRALDSLAALDPKIVVAGHSRPGMPNDRSGIDYTRRYLKVWPELIRQSRNSAELIAKVQARFPDSIDELDNFILGNSARVAMGEDQIWRE